MTAWNKYEAKPITREAMEIVDISKVHQDLRDPQTWYYDLPDGINVVKFKAHQTVVQGDYIVRLTEEDTYHCSKAVFHDRNIVPE
jgi:hypothetical protein